MPYMIPGVASTSLHASLEQHVGQKQSTIKVIPHGSSTGDKVWKTPLRVLTLCSAGLPGLASTAVFAIAWQKKKTVPKAVFGRADITRAEALLAHSMISGKTFRNTLSLKRETLKCLLGKTPPLYYLRRSFLWALRPSLGPRARDLSNETLYIGYRSKACSLRPAIPLCN